MAWQCQHLMRMNETWQSARCQVRAGCCLHVGQPAVSSRPVAVIASGALDDSYVPKAEARDRRQRTARQRLPSFNNHAPRTGTCRHADIGGERQRAALICCAIDPNLPSQRGWTSSRLAAMRVLLRSGGKHLCNLKQSHVISPLTDEHDPARQPIWPEAVLHGHRRQTQERREVGIGTKAC